MEVLKRGPLVGKGLEVVVLVVEGGWAYDFAFPDCAKGIEDGV